MTRPRIPVVTLILVALAVAASGTAGSPPPVRQPAAFRTAGSGADVSVYRGPGMWVDVYDHTALGDPAGAAAAMAAHGIRTLYLETGNYKRPYAVVHPGADSELIEAAHARGIEVVAWYLPEFRDVDIDLRRILRSIEFRTSGGQGFDGFGLDIEANTVEPKERVANLLELSARLRQEVGDDYALGAIIPSPRGMIRVPDYWPGFPWEEIPSYYDVILPMSYYTFHYDGARAAHKYISDNIRLIREHTGDPSVPIHVIGGLTEDTSPWEAAAVIHAARERSVMGASLYGYAGMSDAQWRELSQMPVNPPVATGSPVSLPSDTAMGFLPADRTHPKEVFFLVPPTAGALRLRFQAFDVQPKEVRILVNWHEVGNVWHTGEGQWSGDRRRLVPDRLIRSRRSNLIAFVAVGDFPHWSRWGVRRVSVGPA
ncbi:MAG TPA: hypothetical protein VGB19_03885 [Actinomycetota bacterium]